MAFPLLRRSLLGGAACAAPALFAPATWAQTILPERSLRILVGFQANGGTDIIARLIATQLQRRLGRHVVVENKPGDAGAMPGELVKKGSTDGSTLSFLASTALVSRLDQADFPFNPLVQGTRHHDEGGAVSRRRGAGWRPRGRPHPRGCFRNGVVASASSRRPGETADDHQQQAARRGEGDSDGAGAGLPRPRGRRMVRLFREGRHGRTADRRMESPGAHRARRRQSKGRARPARP